jgi:WXXGXW repeat (2 copies)
MKLRCIIFAAFLFAALPLASSLAQVGISINVAPPVLPVVEQPPVPVEGYIWTPGYWAWGGEDYYLVPGAWVAPPSVGLLWTPPWWGWNNGAYVFNEGYWGPTVGFYGGINYGYGYSGNGYWGGRWEGNAFRYNTAVTRVNKTVIHNTYVDRSVVNKEVNRSRASFNGPNGVKAEATAEQKAAAENAQKTPPTSQQLARREAASKDRNLQASVNHGHPNPDAIKSFNKVEGHGKGAEGLGAAGEKAENKPGNIAEGHREGVEGAAEHGNRRNIEANEAKVRTGKGAAQYGATAHGQHAMTQTSHRPQMGAYHPPPGAKGGYATGQPQPRKKSGKPERPQGQPR